MICISIAQTSRALALVDMHNAARQCDLLEIRLDRFAKPPRVLELLAARPRPVIMSCRRKQDGGDWQGSEEDRLAMLRQAIADGSDYVEIELDVADKVASHAPGKRVISYTNLQENPGNIGEIYKRALKKKPDVVKLTTLATTPEAAWPLLRIVAQAKVPTVIVGLGKPGVMLAVLGRKVGAPWTYAALEKGMEAYPEQPTVSDLHRIYHYQSITKKTRFVGVTGLGIREEVTMGVFNGVFAHLGSPFRCLPLAVGKVPLFRKVMDAVKLSAVIVGEKDRRKLFPLAEQMDSYAKATRAVELLVRRKGTWHGFNHSYKGAVEALATTLRARTGQDKPLKGRIAALVGVNWLAQAIGARLVELGAGVIIIGRDKALAQKLARTLKCRFAAWEAVYSTAHDFLIVCGEDEKAPSDKKHTLHANYLKPGMTVMDLTSGLNASELLHEAEQRGCTVVPPRQLFLSHLQRQVRLLTGKAVPPEQMAVVFNSLLPEGA
jgi:3-dehydroquinate dehydratase/shikimate dehydrogenase